MEPKSLGDHQKLLTDVIKKQIVILGPDITLAKARNVQGLTVADDGTVTAINGDPKLLTQELVNQFMELSGLIVKKTMEPLLAMSENAPTTPVSAPPATSTPSTPPAASQPVISPPAPASAQPTSNVTPTNTASPIANSNTDVQQSKKQG